MLGGERVSEVWTYPPSGFKPDPSKPVRLIERKGQGLYIQYYDVEGRLHELPLVLTIFPPEFNQLKSQLPLTDFWQILNQNIKSSEIMVPVDVQGLYTDAFKQSITLQGSTTQKESGSGSDVDIGAARNLRILVKVTSVSGTTPTLKVCVQGKQRVTGDYEDLACTDTISVTGLYYMSITGTPYRVLRVRWEIGGTSPSFTFGVYAEASF